jgi:hypothetical protein
MTTIALATEDELSEAVGYKLITTFCPNLTMGQKLRRAGNGYLRSRIKSLHAMAKHGHVLLLTDLDKAPCPTQLINAWKGQLVLADALMFRVAVREIESWLLADHNAMRQLFGKKAGSLPDDPDSLPDPKNTLLRLASKAPRRIRDEICKSPGAVARQGIGYNQILCKLTRDSWDPVSAAERSASLSRACSRLRGLT